MKKILEVKKLKDSLRNISKPSWLDKDLLSAIPFIYALLAFALFVRVYKIGTIGINQKEIVNIERILSFSDISNFFNKNISTNLYYLLQFMWGKIFGFSVPSIRFFSVILAVLGLFMFYKFVQEWFSRKLAYIATFLLSISSFHILLSRSISHEVLYPLLLLSAFYTLTLAYRRKNKVYFIVSGVLLGLGLYASEVALALAFVLLISGGFFYYKNKKFLTSFFKEKIIGAVATLLVATPFFYIFFKSPASLISQFTYLPKDIFYNFQDLTATLFYNAQKDIMYNIGSGPLFDPYVTITFILGFFYVLYGIKRRKFFFLCSWLGLMSFILIIRSSFSLAGIIYIAPILFIFSAIIQNYVLQKWFQTFPFNRAARASMTLGIGLFFAFSLTYNFQKAFLAWGKNSDRKFSYNTSVVLDEAPKDKKTYLYSSGMSYDAARIVLDIKNKENLIEIENIGDIKEIKNVNIITSQRGISAVKIAFLGVNLKEEKGKDIYLLKGE